MFPVPPALRISSSSRRHSLGVSRPILVLALRGLCYLSMDCTSQFSPRPRKPVADRPAGSVPSVLANPPLETRNIPLSPLLADCVMALAPGLVVPTPPAPTDAHLPYFRKIALLSEAELS